MTGPRANRSLKTVSSLALVSSLIVLRLAVAAPATAATGGWTISANPTSVTKSVATNVHLTATNTAGGSSVGCVQATVPSAFAVATVAIDSAPAGLQWTADSPAAGSGGSTIVKVHAVTEADILKTDGTAMTFHVGLTGNTVGAYSWPAESLDHHDCTSGIDTASVSVSVVAAAPTPTPTPSPTPTPTPRPTPTPTPRPTLTPTPSPTPPATPQPTPTPTSTAHPTPRPSTTVAPTQSLTPQPTPTGTAPVNGPPSATPLAAASAPPSPVDSTPSSSPSLVAAESASTSASDTPSLVSTPENPADSSGGGSTTILTLGDADAGVREVDANLVSTTLIGIDGPLVWAIPSLVLSVPGFLVLLVILAQVGGAAAWLPMVRKKLGRRGGPQSPAR